jgi:acylphosphatase
MVRRRVVVSGRVQGVFFRDECRREAVSRGVAGWVCNRGDGSVEAVLEGAPEAVEGLVTWMRTGPSHAEVVDVRVSPEEPAGASGFAVR